MDISNFTGESSLLWPVDSKRYYPGRVRNEFGVPLSGFRVLDTLNMRKVSIVQNGNYLRHFRFPHRIVAPQNPLINWRNSLVMGVTDLIDPDGRNLSDSAAKLESVLSGKSPVVFIEAERQFSEGIAKAVDLGFEVYEGAVAIGINQPLAELFDFDAISDFYFKALEGKVDRTYFKERLLRSARQTPLQALRSISLEPPVTLATRMVNDLCLGRAFESTLSVMLDRRR